MTEAPAEQPIRLGPTAANIARSIWHQKELLVLGLVLGLALGWLALPKVLSGGSTYDATIRMKVEQAPADAVVGIPPCVRPSRRVRRPDRRLARGAQGRPHRRRRRQAARQEQGQDRRRCPARPHPILLLNRLSITPLEGTSYVDLAFSDGDPALAAAVVEQYAGSSPPAATDPRPAWTARTDLEERPAEHSARGPPAKRPPGRGRARDDQQGEDPQGLPGDPTEVTGQVMWPPTPRREPQGHPGPRLLLGLGIGAGAGLLVETAFRKVVTPTDAEDASRLPFIAQVRGRHRDPLPVIDRPFSPAAEDYRRVGTALERQGLGSDIRVLAIVSAEPGDGRTLLAANLAHSLARQGREVVLVSSDLRRPDVEKLLGLGQGPGLAESLQDDPIPAIAMLVSINDHLLVLPAGMPSKHPGELLASKRLLETIQTLRQIGIVILDTPPARPLGRRHHPVQRRRRHPVRGQVGRDPDAVGAGGHQSACVATGSASSAWSWSGPAARSSARSSARGDLRDQPDLELDELEPPAQPRQLQFNPRSLPPAPEPSGNGNATNGSGGSGDDEHAGEVADIKAAERNRRAAE